jgi:hypothetical protein
VIKQVALSVDPGDDDPTPPADEPDCGGGDGCGRQ